MIKCSNCGTENALGKVFCAQCGAKLDLSAINEEEIEDMGQASRLLSYWPIYILVVVVVVVGLAGLSLWPPSKPLGEAGPRSSAGFVKGQLTVMKNIAKGHEIRSAFSEKQVNAYMSDYTVKRLSLKSFSVDIEGDTMKARLVRTMGPWGIADYKYPVSFSLEVECTAPDGGLVVGKGTIGHLPLPGPLGTVAGSLMRSALKDADEWKSLKNVKEVSIEDGRITLRASG